VLNNWLYVFMLDLLGNLNAISIPIFYFKENARKRIAEDRIYEFLKDMHSLGINTK